MKYSSIETITSALESLSSLYKFDKEKNIYVVSGSGLAIRIGNTLSNGKIEWVALCMDLELFARVGPSAYISVEEFFDRIPEEYRTEFLFHLDLFR